jgi:hypothetical protein
MKCLPAFAYSDPLPYSTKCDEHMLQACDLMIRENREAVMAVRGRA